MDQEKVGTSEEELKTDKCQAQSSKEGTELTGQEAIQKRISSMDQEKVGMVRRMQAKGMDAETIAAICDMPMEDVTWLLEALKALGTDKEIKEVEIEHRMFFAVKADAVKMTKVMVIIESADGTEKHAEKTFELSDVESANGFKMEAPSTQDNQQGREMQKVKAENVKAQILLSLWGTQEDTVNDHFDVQPDS